MLTQVILLHSRRLWLSISTGHLSFPAKNSIFYKSTSNLLFLNILKYSVTMWWYVLCWFVSYSLRHSLFGAIHSAYMSCFKMLSYVSVSCSQPTSVILLVDRACIIPVGPSLAHRPSPGNVVSLQALPQNFLCADPLLGNQVQLTFEELWGHSLRYL